MARTGRPSKLTPELTAAICEDIRTTGAPAKVAAQAHGIGRSTFFDWCARGAKEEAAGSEGRHRDFLDAVAQAKAKWQVEALRKVEDIESYVSDKRAATAFANSITWKLERLERETYGSQITVKVEEAKTYLLDTLEQVCERMGAQEVLLAVLDELERGGSTEEGRAPGEAASDVVH